MQLQPFGYTRTFTKYAWAVLHPSGRTHYPDTFRAPTPTGAPAVFALGPVAAAGPAAVSTPAATTSAHTAADVVTAVRADAPASNAAGHALVGAWSALSPAAPPSPLSRWLADAVSAAPMHTLRVVGGSSCVEKRRRPALLVLIPLWNLWLAALREPIRVLSGRAWHARERALHHLCTGQDAVRSCGPTLSVPLLSGRPGDELLRDSDLDPVSMLTAAALALRNLHAADESHGDAILGNVLLDPAQLPEPAAHWIDFETCHAAALLPPERRADDLWTLARSAAYVLGSAYADVIATATAAACLDEVTRRCLVIEAASPTRSSTVLALARVPLTGAPLDALRRAVLDRLDSADPASMPTSAA